MVLYNGDVLVTKTKGHTAIVTSGNPRKNVKDHLNPYPEPARILKKKFPCMRGDDVRWLQTELIYHGCLDEKDKRETVMWTVFLEMIRRPVLEHSRKKSELQ